MPIADGGSQKSPVEAPRAHSGNSLTPQEELQLQQLLQARFWQEKSQSALSSPHVTDVFNSEQKVARPPDRWELTRGLVLHDWQRRCIDAWFTNGKRGVIKVVTGAGKTILALGIAERLQQSEVAQLRIAIVVPTVVLLEQWREEFAMRSNLPLESIGLIGGGRNDTFSDRVRVLICVLNSASKKLAHEVERAGVSRQLLLIVDECHRAGAAEMQRVFRTKRAYSLGLSATPERDDAPSADLEAEGLASEEYALPPIFEETVLGRELGSVIFEMNYAEAMRLGVLPPFRIVHYGLSLDAKERENYEHISREIKDLRADLETSNRRGLALIRWCRSKAAAHNPKAARLIALTNERKHLLYRIRERPAAVLGVIREAFQLNPNTKAILFHESIDEVMILFAMLRDAGYPVVAEHSEFPDQMRAESLRLFRSGIAQVIVSARSLIEGFNVPSADLGIIVAASASVRQRVQTLGRLLRTSRREDGSEKQATLYVLYASETVDELIYEKADWEQFVGTDRNEYYLWPEVGKSEPVPRQGPPRIPMPDEIAVDIRALRPGAPYPGNPDQGRLYTLDTQGTIRDENGNLVKPHLQLRTILSRSRKAGGRFRVTPVNQFVIELEKTREGWQSVYLGRLDTPLRIVELEEADDDVSRRYLPGHIYPLGRVRGKTFSVLQRDKRLIAHKSSSGIRFVISAEQIEDPQRQMALRQIQQHLADVHARGQRISKITVTKEGHVVYVFNNQAYFVGYAPEGPEGFLFEDKNKPNR